MSATALSGEASHGLLTPARAALLVAVVGAGAILGALFIQYGLGILPCELCLKQRIPYYSGIPLALLTAWYASRQPRTGLTLALLILLALVFAAGAGLGAYHSGVEWGFWAGPQDCTGATGPAVPLDNFLKSLDTVKVVRCDQVAMRLFGLSLAAWNAIVATGLTLVALAGARATRG